MNAAPEVPSRLAAVEAQLLGPGAPFELTDDEVLGERVRVFAHRARSLRDVPAFW